MAPSVSDIRSADAYTAAVRLALASVAAVATIVSVASVALVGCGQVATTSRSSEVRGGTTDGGDPAVAALSANNTSYCTASLISHHTLLTAGHCVITGARADFGPSELAATQRIAVKSMTRHPMFSGDGAPYDFALVELAADPTGITPLALDETPLDAGDVGRAIRHVGFGVTDDSTGSGGGVKRTVSYPINRVAGMLVYSGAPGEQTCGGDSGGPGLLPVATGGEVIAAIVSDGPACQLSQDGWDDRVDLVKDWIVQTTSSWDAPPALGDGGLPHAGDAAIDASDEASPDAGTDAKRHHGCSSSGQPGAAMLVVLAIAWARRRTRTRHEVRASRSSCRRCRASRDRRSPRARCDTARRHPASRPA